MSRNARLALVLIVALCAAAAASFVVYRAVSSIPVREVEVASLQAVVAAKPIPVGTLLTPDHVRLVPWPARSPVPGSFTSIEGVVNRGAIVEISENEPITESRLAPLGSGGGLPPTIPEGMRAISVRTNEVVGVAGFVIPGTRVDVLVTGRPPTSEGDMTSTVLQNMLVLSAGTTIQADARGQAIQAPTVTLLATPAQSETLTLAGNEGRLQLVLRNSSDQSVEQTTGRYISELYGAPRKAAAPAAPAVHRPAPRPVVIAAAQSSS